MTKITMTSTTTLGNQTLTSGQSYTLRSAEVDHLVTNGKGTKLDTKRAK